MTDKKSKNLIIEHLEEIRKRIIICGISLILGSLVTFSFADYIRRILIIPAGNITLIYTNPSEAFLANVRVAVFTGIIVSMPVIIYQFLAYILPALYKEERKTLLTILFGMIFMFTCGIVFSYKIAFPITIKFFLQFTADDLIPLYTITEYISFVSKFLLVFGFIFLLPILFLGLSYMNLVTPEILVSIRRYVILGLAIFAAVITPPDVVSQIMVLVPLLVLYEVGIILVRITRKKKVLL